MLFKICACPWEGQCVPQDISLVYCGPPHTQLRRPAVGEGLNRSSEQNRKLWNVAAMMGRWGWAGLQEGVLGVPHATPRLWGDEGLHPTQGLEREMRGCRRQTFRGLIFDIYQARGETQLLFLYPRVLSFLPTLFSVFSSHTFSSLPYCPSSIPSLYPRTENSLIPFSLY